MIFLSDMEQEQQCEFLRETVGHALLDSGCFHTVCGQLWVDLYIESLSCKDKKDVEYLKSSKSFRFGNGKKIEATKKLAIPVYIGDKRMKVMTDVVEADVPLLLSKSSLQRAEAKIDFENNQITILDQILPLSETSGGHYLLSLTREMDSKSDYVQRILFTSPFSENDMHNEQKVKKLHRQFAHTAAEPLKKLLQTAGIKDKRIMKLVDSVTENCTTCKKLKRPANRPVVGLPLASEFNELVALDLKSLQTGGYFLNMIDHATRYNAGCIIYDKKKETIVHHIMTHWVQPYGAPGKMLSDNGGEFINKDVIEYAEKFNVKIRTTAAESGWSNGLCERHNAIVAATLRKVMLDTGCPVEVALAWTLSAKNSLANVYGFTPNQLVFGHNPIFPSILHNRAPANNPICYSKLVQQHLEALHSARQNFLKAEADEKVKRALNKQTRTYSDKVFSVGDQVYYKRLSSHYWHGPAKVLGKENQTYLLKHGGYYIRVHPCRLEHVGDVDNPPSTSSPDQTASVDLPETHGVSIDDDDDDDISIFCRAGRR